jgi:hypothetical protein
VNTARLNASACKCGQKYIYLFGGLDVEKNEMTDSIERYNTQLHIWTTLSQIKMPAKISNSFAFCFDPKFILIMGGITKKEIPTNFGGAVGLQSQNPTNSVIDVNKTFEIQNRVHVLKITDNDTKFKWK